MRCGFRSLKFDSFMYLNIPIPDERNRRTVTLQDCLEEFTKEELLDDDQRWYCPQCKKHRQISKKIDIWKVPGILVINLKRFRYNRQKRGKIRQLVDFPLEDVDFSGYTVGPQKERPTYDVFGIINHEGSLHSGHYTALSKSKELNSWIHFNDSRMRQVTGDPSKIVTEAAYVLFLSKNSMESYRRQSLSMPQYWPHVIALQEKKRQIASSKRAHLQAENNHNISKDLSSTSISSTMRVASNTSISYRLSPARRMRNSIIVQPK